MKRVMLFSSVALVLAAFASAQDLSLVQTLAKQLNVTDAQAAGGAGSLLSYAKGAVSKDDFGKVTKAVPEVGDLVKKAPKTDSKTSAVSGALGQTGGGSVAGLASVGSSFQKLGLSSDMVGKFAPIVVDYVDKKGGSQVGGILRKVLIPEKAPAKQ